MTLVQFMPYFLYLCPSNYVYGRKAGKTGKKGKDGDTPVPKGKRYPPLLWKRGEHLRTL